eukprot:sb/3467143/
MTNNPATTSDCNLWTFLRRPTPVHHMDVDSSPPSSAEPSHSTPSSPPHSPPFSPPPGTPQLESPTYFPHSSSPSSPSNPPSVPPISPVSEYYVGYSDYEDEEEDRLNIAYLPSPPTYLPERLPSVKQLTEPSFPGLHPSTGPQQSTDIHPEPLPEQQGPLPGLLPLPTQLTLPEPPCINCGSISSGPDISPLLNPPARMDRPTLLNIPSRPTLPPLNIPPTIPSSPFLSPSSPLDAPFAALSLTSPPPVRRKLRSTRRKSTLSSEQRAVLTEFDAVKGRWSAAERRRIAKCAGVSELNVFEWFSGSKW